MAALSVLAAIIGDSVTDIESQLAGMIKTQTGVDLNSDQCFVDRARGVGLAVSGGDIADVIHFDNAYNIAVVFSGRITNAPSLSRGMQKDRMELGSCGFAEIVSNLYARDGIDCVERLHGYFCFVLWDGNRRQLFAVRDHMGGLPLFFADGEGSRCVIASEVSAILHTGLFSKSLDPDAISHYLHDKSFLQPSTPFKSIKSIPPGFRLHCCNGKPQIKNYYRPRIKPNSISAAEVIDTADTLLCEILEEQIAPFDKIGVCFSGGVDSLLITAMLKAVTDKPIYTYTVCGGDNGKEMKFAKDASKHFGTRHTMVEFNGSVVKSFLSQINNSYPVPGIGGWQIFMSTKAVQRDGLEMAFSGHGAEVAFGVDWVQKKYAQLHSVFGFLDVLPISIQKRLVVCLREFIKKWHSKNYAEYDNLYLLIGYLETRVGFYYWDSSRLTEDRIASLLKCDSRSFKSVSDIYLQNHADSGSSNFMDQMNFARLVNYEGNHAQGKNNYLAQSNNVELLLPFMDRRFLDFGLTIPNALKSKNGVYKYLEVELAKRYHDFTREKAAFSMSFAKWLRSDLKSIATSVFDPDNIDSWKIFRSEEVSSLWDEFVEGSEALYWTDIQAFISLDMWLKGLRREDGTRLDYR